MSSASFHHNSSHLADLESALASVLKLEEIYTAKLRNQSSNKPSTSKNNNNNNNSLDDILRMGTINSKSFSQIENSRVFGHLVGGASANGGLEALLRGGNGIRKVHSLPGNLSKQNNYHDSSNGERANQTQQREDAEKKQESEKNESEAKRNWLNLDERLLRLASSSSVGTWNEEDNFQSDLLQQRQHGLDKVLADLVRGRPDRWVRIASVAEREGLRNEIGTALNQIAEKKERRQDDASACAKAGNKEENEAAQQLLKEHQNLTHDVVLGSASSSICRAILNSLLME